MNPPRFILELNTRVWLRRLGEGRMLTLCEVPDGSLDEWRAQGFDAIWLMGVWMPSAGSLAAALKEPVLLQEYSRALPGWKAADVGGSPFGVAGYRVNPAIGGEAGLADFRRRLTERGLRLLLDFVPNHLAMDHPWVREHPDWFVMGTEADVVMNPTGYFWVGTEQGMRAIAHGRDPYFPPWTDSAQLDYHNPELAAAMRGELARIATLCDGVRCDMAMLELADVFEQVWQRRPEEFWPRAIAAARETNPDFFLMAEVYWGLDGKLREMGFDATYDKDLLDRIGYDKPLSTGLFALPADEHRRRVRFLENHDEPRMASRLNDEQNMAAATWVFSLPTVRLLYDGQLDGAKVRLPVQLLREPVEPANTALRDRYGKLLTVLQRSEVQSGKWQLLNPRMAWSGNPSCDSILGQGYDRGEAHLRVFVNWSATRSQCWVPLNLDGLQGMQLELTDLTGSKAYVRDGMEFMIRGLYLDLEPWETHMFECRIKPLI